MAVKDYLGFENARNKRHAAAYIALMQAAFGDVAVFVGHHLSFEANGDLSTENEIPAADTLLFDHEVMEKVFGSDAQRYMVELALRPCDERDEHLAHLLELRRIGAIGQWPFPSGAKVAS